MPKLLEGKWENVDSSDTNTMHVLVSQNDMGLHSGDEIMGQYFLSNGDSKNITIKIDGVYRYTVFYLNGMKWSSGIKLSAFSAGCNIIFSMFFMIGTVCILQLNNISMAYKIQYGFYEILIVGIVCVFFFFASIIMPIIIIKKERPAELLKKNE